MAASATATKRETQFIWEGKDKRGNKVRGKALAANETALRADLRRQGVAARSNPRTSPYSAASSPP
jgi:type II secretory pathway component PulF